MKKISLLLMLPALVLVGCTGPSSSTSPSDTSTTVGANEITDYSELKGKVVANIGEGNVPDQVFQAILTKEGIPFEKSTTAIEGKVALTYMSSGAEMAGFLDTNKADFVIGGEPSISPLLSSLEDSYIASDLQETYGDAFDQDGGYPQAVLIAKKDYVDTNPNEVYAITQAVKDASSYLEDNLDETKADLAEAGSKALASIDAEIVKRSNITYKTKDTQQNAIKTLLETFTAASYGGALPTDEFYPTLPTSGETTTEALKIYTPDGAPALALSKVASMSNVTLEVATDPTILPSKFSPAGDANFAVVPSNMASIIFKNFGAEFLATVTYGNLYMVGVK